MTFVQLCMAAALASQDLFLQPSAHFLDPVSLAREMDLNLKQRMLFDGGLYSEVCFVLLSYVLSNTIFLAHHVPQRVTCLDLVCALASLVS